MVAKGFTYLHELKLVDSEQHVRHISSHGHLIKLNWLAVAVIILTNYNCDPDYATGLIVTLCL